jgi:hypothetical protein
MPPVETFIVRVWTPSQDLAHEISSPELHGSVEHIGTKDQRQFRNAGDLLEILSAVLRTEPEGRAERLKPT